MLPRTTTQYVPAKTSPTKSAEVMSPSVGKKKSTSRIVCAMRKRVAKEEAIISVDGRWGDTTISPGFVYGMYFCPASFRHQTYVCILLFTVNQSYIKVAESSLMLLSRVLVLRTFRYFSFAFRATSLLVTYYQFRSAKLTASAVAIKSWETTCSSS